MNSAGSENGSLTSRGCTSQVISSPFSLDRRELAAGGARHRARQRSRGGTFVRAIWLSKIGAENTRVVCTLADLSHVASAIPHVHGTKGTDAAFVRRPTLRSMECLTER